MRAFGGNSLSGWTRFSGEEPAIGEKDKSLAEARLAGPRIADTFTGDAGANTILGTSGDDFIDGKSGNDTLSGLGGDDDIRGGAGNDILNGSRFLRIGRIGVAKSEVGVRAG